ncbi:hypothetical protein J5N97_010196 [Dioscorea zingiberensis]|uniref:CCHC-type domain-containing protein n=1 Tax=Dioscorea zingiberensis TaxID=325984 RepID=A0A9D5CYL6_9LILI|nr:hypothetical protein J5N97_010196 [Dioscorea zingiberensis]
MIDCRRVEVCRRCERPGHRATKCTVPSSELGIYQSHEGEPSCNKGKKKGGPCVAASGEPSDRECKQEGRATNHQKIKSETEENHNGSIAIDDSMVEEIRWLRTLTIATVTKGFAGLEPHKKVMAEIAGLTAPELAWKVEPFEDGRFLIHCPSADIARNIESKGELSFPGFTVRCDPCPAATNSTGKAEGELRWIHAKGLPIFCRRRDMIARLLKPVGDLVYLAREGVFYAGHYKAMIRVRRGKKLPIILNYSVLTNKYTVRVELARGEPPLPWDLPPEKTVAPGGAVKAVGGDRLLTRKNPIGPLEKDQSRGAGPEKYDKPPAHATPSSAKQAVVRGSRGGMEASSAFSQPVINGVDDEHVEGQNARQPQKTKANVLFGSRHVDGYGESSRKNQNMRALPSTRLHENSGVDSCNSPKDGQLAPFAQPPQSKREGKRVIGVDSDKGHVASFDGERQSRSQPLIKHKNDDNGLWQGKKSEQSSTMNKNEVLKENCNDISNGKKNTLPLYSDFGMDDIMDADEEWADHLEKEIAIEMENLWNTQLDVNDDKQDEKGTNFCSSDPTNDQKKRHTKKNFQ